MYMPNSQFKQIIGTYRILNCIYSAPNYLRSLSVSVSKEEKKTSCLLRAAKWLDTKWRRDRLLVEWIPINL